MYRGRHFRAEDPFFLYSNVINIYGAPVMFLTKPCAYLSVGSLNPYKTPLKEVLASPCYR